MSKHTPGPWRATSGGRVIAQDGEWRLQVCKVGAFDDPEMLRHSKSRWEADARLIAAAPELLAALDYALAVADEGLRLGPEWREKTRAVIVKAKGETE